MAAQLLEVITTLQMIVTTQRVVIPAIIDVGSMGAIAAEITIYGVSPVTSTVMAGTALIPLIVSAAIADLDTAAVRQWRGATAWRGQRP